MQTSPKRAVRWIFLVLLCSICFLDYWGYSTEFHKNPGGNFDILAGQASAPQQYRVLIVRAAGVLQQHMLFPFRYSFVLFDLLAGGIAGFLLLKLIERSPAFRRVGDTGRWLAYVAFLFLFSYYLLWLDWYQRPETLPSTCFVAVMLTLLSWRTTRPGNLFAIASGTLLVSLLQALTRADVAVCFYIGAFLYALSNRNGLLPTARWFNIVLTAAAAALAAGVQWVLMHRIYPHAGYGDTPLFQLHMNLVQPLRITPFLLFMAPVVWTLYAAVRRQDENEPAAAALLVGVLLFLPLWIVLGKIDEVRIFIPFAVALIPLTVSHLLGALADDPTSGPASTRNA